MDRIAVSRFSHFDAARFVKSHACDILQRCLSFAMSAEVLLGEKAMERAIGFFVFFLGV